MKPRKANLEESMQRVTVGDVLAFEKNEMSFNQAVSFLADMVVIGHSNPRWREMYCLNTNSLYGLTIATLLRDEYIDPSGNVLKWFPS